MVFFFYFPNRDAAEAAQNLFLSKSFKVAEAEHLDGEWSVKIALPNGHEQTDPESLREGFDAIAALFGGEYDGWEKSVEN